MKSIRTQLTQLFTQAFTSRGLDAKFGNVTISDRPDLGHYQCNGALSGAKSIRRNPRDLAQEIINDVNMTAATTYGRGSLSFSMAGPGFINATLSDALLAQLTQEQALDSRLGCEPSPRPRTVVIDYGGPNVAKTMHVGHLRSSIIGDSLVRLHRFMGDTVIGDNHIGDWGTQMGMLLCEVKRRQPDLPYFDSNIKGPYPDQSPVTLADLEEMYPAASKRYGEDEIFKQDVLRATDELQRGRPGYKALWQHFVRITIETLEADFGRLGIKFDTWLGESFYEEHMPVLVEQFKQKGITQLSDGALIVPVADEQDPDIPPVILVKSGGGFLYHTSDLATIQYRIQNLKADLVLYVVDKRQSLHFKQVFKAAHKTGLSEKADLRHLPFGTMNGADGKPFKTREGGVLKLKDLIQMTNEEARKRLSELEIERSYDAKEMESIAEKVGIATLKYADLKHSRTTDYIFDLEKFAKFEGNTGPYLLYATVRIKSIFRKAMDQGLKLGTILPPRCESERKLLIELLKLPDVLQSAYDEDEPHHICDYGFGLSQVFNAFYAECHILRESDPARKASWLALSKLCLEHLELTLSLLGIDVPERM